MFKGGLLGLIFLYSDLYTGIVTGMVAINKNGDTREGIVRRNHKVIISLIESGHRSSNDAKRLGKGKFTISRLLKRRRMRGDTENKHRS